MMLFGIIMIFVGLYWASLDEYPKNENPYRKDDARY